jgi:hypothetical protein
MYVRAIQLQENLVDIHVRLANICLLDGEIEKCVEACDNVLRELSLPRSKTLHDIQDLAGLFFLIGWGLKQAGKNKLSQEAGQTGNLLRQIQGEQSSAWGIKKDSKLQQFPI